MSDEPRADLRHLPERAAAQRIHHLEYSIKLAPDKKVNLIRGTELWSSKGKLT